MKKILYIIALMIFAASCGNNTQEANSEKALTMPGKKKIDNTQKEFGEKIVMERVADVKRLPGMLENTTSKEIKVIGLVTKVCQSEGCWLDMDLGEGKTLHVTFKDESFVVPKDIAGKAVVVQGVATKETVPVDMLKKIAADEGVSEAEIQKITQPETEYSIEANGLIIK